MNPAPLSPNRSRTPWYSRLLDALLKLLQRRALREMLELRSDRLLADAGFSRAELAAQVRTAVDDYRESRQIEQRVCRELATYSDRELSDIGLGRSDIRRLAREAARQVLAARRLGRLGAQQHPQANANDNAGRPALPADTAA